MSTKSTMHWVSIRTHKEKEMIEKHEGNGRDKVRKSEGGKLDGIGR